MMTCFLIADTFKKGMKSHGCPGLIPYKKNLSLFEQQYRTIKNVFPKSQIVYVYGFDNKRFTTFMKDKTNSFGALNTVLNTEYDKYNHGYSLSLCREHLEKSEQCLILFGYESINQKIIGHTKIKTNKESIAIISENTNSKLGCVINNNQTINHIFFDLDNSIADIYMLMKPEINILLEVLKNNTTNNMFLFEIINKIILESGTIKPLFIG